MSDIVGSISAIAANNNLLFKIEDTTKSALSVDSLLADANIVHISKDDYEKLVATSATISNTLYIVSSDFIDAYGQLMKNLAAGTDLSDAVNLELLNSLSSKIDNLLDIKIPYSIVEPETSGTALLSVQVQDHAINVLSADSSITNILFIFPQKMTGKARDFFVRLTITSITDVPTIEFLEQDGSAVSFDIDDMSWAEIESGVNLILFTETAL